MIMSGSGNPGLTVRGPTPADADFAIEQVERLTVIAPGGTTTRTTDDANYTDETTATVDRVSDLIVTETVPLTFRSAPVFESLDPAVATVDSNGVLTRVADGNAQILVRTRRVTKSATVAIARLGGAAASIFNGYVTGSLSKHCSDAIDTRIAGKDPSAAKLIHDGTAYNAARWCADIDLTCISREIPRCTLIAPDVVVMAEHYQPSGPITFLAADGSVVTRTIVAKVGVGPPNASDGYASDIVVGRLASAVPASITPAKVMPASISSYLASIVNGVPALCLDQDENALVGTMYSIAAGGIVFRTPVNTQRLLFYEPKVSGDSGNPAFLLIDGDPVLLTTWTFGGAGSGPNYPALIGSINTAIAAAGSASQLTIKDLSAYPTY